MEARHPDASDSGERLDGWKQIAAYLKRNVRTVQRWERSEQFPVHRQLHRKLGSVFAFKGELDHLDGPTLFFAERKGRNNQLAWLRAEEFEQVS